MGTAATSQCCPKRDMSQPNDKPYEFETDCGVSVSKDNKSATLVYGEAPDAKGEPSFTGKDEGSGVIAMFRWGLYGHNSDPIPQKIWNTLTWKVEKQDPSKKELRNVTLKVSGKGTELPGDFRKYFVS